MSSEDFLAVIGMAGRFPGAAGPAAFFRNLTGGVESVRRLPGGAYGVVEDGDRFDAGFFGYSPREALMMDPQHRVFLECAWEAIEDAGYDPTGYPGVVGVYAGSGDTGHHGTLMAHRDRLPGVSEWQLRLASGADFLTSRVAYKLNLTGPAVTVQTACSTSLVAVHLAAQALLAGECDLALAGGVTVRVPAPSGEVGDEGVLAADGACRAFDAAATGTVGGDGAGIVVLKRLGEAIEDGDHVYAVLRGTAVTNDGSAKMGFTAPSVAGQAEAAAAAYAVAGVDPATVGYVEAHGTGTPVGDPIEVRALARAFSGGGDCVLGSVKPAIGHTDAAAGVIGLIKAVLALHHEVIPGTLHFRTPNPELGLSGTPFTITAGNRPWPRADRPRRAGVNALGIGGTNAHAVLEEAPLREASPTARTAHLLPISARDPLALREAAARLADRLDTIEPDDGALADVAWTLQSGRRAFGHRAFVVAADAGEAARELRHVASATAGSGGGVAFLFPGQGGQHVGMARDLYEQEPVFRDTLDEIAALARPELGVDLREALYPAADAARAAELMATMRIGQPALFAVEHALAELWRARGVVPQVVLGHSLGAYAAAVSAGALDAAGALELVMERGRLFDGLPEGLMLAVPAAPERLEPYLDASLSIAAVNGPDQCVLAGPAAGVRRLRERLTAEGLECRVLRIGAAAHSSLVDPVVAAFERRVAEVGPAAPGITWISDRTGLPVTADQARDPAYWGGHLRHTVRFADALRTLLTEHEGPLLEIGPGHTLGALARRHPACAPDRTVLVSLPHPAEQAGGATTLATATGALWQAGTPIDWTALHAGERRGRTPLPAYPFQREAFRLDGHERPAAEPRLLPAPAPRENAGTEHALRAAFGQVLGMEPEEVDAHDDFFDLGGDSLVATQVVTLIRHSVGVEVSPGELFRARTVSRLSRLIEEREAA